MPKKSRKGFYVKGKFVTEVPEPDATSRTAKKKASERLQEIGAALVAAKVGLLDQLPLPEVLTEAILEAKEQKSFGAKRRQLQYIGKLMRRLDDEELAAVRASLGIEA
jgi:ribosome-associated protein